jgi:hypothetical protein
MKLLQRGMTKQLNPASLPLPNLRHPVCPTTKGLTLRRRVGKKRVKMMVKMMMNMGRTLACPWRPLEPA